jgi:hypothetical protein
MTKRKVRSVTIIGRKWFEKINGNTYFTAEILVNGIHVHSMPYEYGYGEQYEQASLGWLEKAELIPARKQYANGGKEQVCQWKDREGIEFYSIASYVATEREL